MIIHNVGFYEEMEKIIFQSSSNTYFIPSSAFIKPTYDVAKTAAGTELPKTSLVTAHTNLACKH